jgi:uncharacterized protein YaaQ
MMKMVMAVVPRDQAGPVLNGLIAEGYVATFTESRGGFLRQAQHIVFIAVKETDVDEVLGIIKDYCRGEVQVQSAQEAMSEFAKEATPAEVGGAAVFVWDLERFETY